MQLVSNRGNVGGRRSLDRSLVAPQEASWLFKEQQEAFARVLRRDNKGLPALREGIERRN